MNYKALDAPHRLDWTMDQHSTLVRSEECGRRNSFDETGVLIRALSLADTSIPKRGSLEPGASLSPGSERRN